MRLTDRATDELEVLLSMYPDAVITEHDADKSTEEYFVSVIVSLNPSENVPPLEIELFMNEKYLDDVDSAPLQIKRIKFIRSTNTNGKIKSSKCNIPEIKALECQLFQEAHSLVMEFIGQEVIFDFFNQIKESIDNIPDVNRLFRTPTPTQQGDKEGYKIPTKNIKLETNTSDVKLSRIQFCLIKWHHMLPGRQHTKEANVWDALGASIFYKFALVCLGKPSMGIIEFVEDYEGDNERELQHFLSQCGKHGKKPMMIFKESLNNMTNPFGYNETILNSYSTSKPIYIPPAGTSKKNEKPDLGKFKEILLQRCGDKLAIHLINQIIEA